jgi:hypothetical protein
MKHKKTGRKTQRRMRGGFYSFGGDVMGNNGGKGSGAPAWSSGSEMGGFAIDKGANKIIHGRGRRRKQRKTRRRKTMRGGGKFGGVSAEFTGTGYRGMGNYVGGNTRVPPFTGPAKHGAFNDGGAHAGNFKSFGGLFPQ